MFSFLDELSNKQTGFIPDVISILQLYDLTPHLQSWLNDGYFPNKYAWKRIVRNAVNRSHELYRQNRMNNDPEMIQFCQTFSHTKPADIWKLPSSCREITLCKFAVKLCTFSHVNINTLPENCSVCGIPFRDVFFHSSCSCPSTGPIRLQWWDTITNDFDVHLCAELCQLTEYELYLVLLGGHTSTPLQETEYVSFRLLNFGLVRAAAAHYNRTLAQLGVSGF